MTDYEVDPIVWFSNRRMEHPPAHFVMATTLLTEDSLQWVLNSLRGRYAITTNTSDLFSFIESLGNISFEDPSEATLYELRWS
jgi:hypothetical protein